MAGERITEELKAAGVSTYGRLKHPSKQLQTMIRADEHIEAAAYGQSAQGSAMLIATDKRVIFIEGNVMYNSSDDFGYDVVTGVTHHSTMLFEAVTLYTKLQTYHLTYVNRASAERFVKVIEDKVAIADTSTTRRMDVGDDEESVESHYAHFTDEIRAFLKSHDTMVVSPHHREPARSTLLSCITS